MANHGLLRRPSHQGNGALKQRVLQDLMALAQEIPSELGRAYFGE